MDITKDPDADMDLEIGSEPGKVCKVVSESGVKYSGSPTLK
jgi:hypothetical protein